jgi:NTE family protein
MMTGWGEVIDRLSGKAVRRSLVLAVGGPFGTAWMAGLAAGLRHRGIDLSSADSIVGTSAGAIVGAMLVTGRDLDSLADTPRRPGSAEQPPAMKPDLLAAALSVLSAALADPTRDPIVARREVGRLVMDQQPAQPEQIERIAWLAGGNAWTDHRLRITAVDAETGQRQIWDRDSGVELGTAVAAGRAFPGTFPPVVVTNASVSRATCTAFRPASLP